MNINKNDYVVLNGKRYYAMGGKVSQIDGLVDDENLRRDDKEKTKGNKQAEAKKKAKSVNAGHIFYNELNRGAEEGVDRRQKFREGRGEITKFLRKFDPSFLRTNYGIDVDKWDKETNDFKDLKYTKLGNNIGYDNDNSRRVHYFIAEQTGSPFFEFQKNDDGTPNLKKDKEGFYGIPLGANITNGIVTSKYQDDVAHLTPKERAYMEDKYGKAGPDNLNYTTFVDDDGYKHVVWGNKYTTNGNFYKTSGNVVTVFDRSGNALNIVPEERTTNKGGTYTTYKISDNQNDPNGIKELSNYKRSGAFLNTRNYTPNISAFNNQDLMASYNTDDNRVDFNDNGEYGYYERDNQGNLITDNNGKYIFHKYSFGGRTTRLYAVGGLTGEQIPIGEQPEDYNMVGAGGSHEQNPMGGVPYGVNQDGSQNMVEEGEVSVGNNVFSDRTAISPELCQQLGLPEGTSPAQAMQQIEALYEQGQIGDEEFQEIQQIIFEDQEAQKQNVGQSYQQGEVGGEGVPQEGITTDMMQGSSMPPEAMQGGMQPMPQQGAPMPQTEGITPDMVQGGMYGCGGRMRRW